MPYSDKCMRVVRLSFNSHFKIEKSDLTDVVLENMVAKPPQNEHKRSK